MPAEDYSNQATWHLLSTSDWGSSEKILPGYDEGRDYLLHLTHALPSPWVPRCCTERSQFPARRVTHPLWTADSTGGRGGSSCTKKWAHLKACSETRGTHAESSVQPERTAALNGTPWQQDHVEVIFQVTVFQVTMSSSTLAAARDRLSEQLVNTQMALLCFSLKPHWSEFSCPSLQLPFRTCSLFSLGTDGTHLCMGKNGASCHSCNNAHTWAWPNTAKPTSVKQSPGCSSRNGVTCTFL